MSFNQQNSLFNNISNQKINENVQKINNENSDKILTGDKIKSNLFINSNIVNKKLEQLDKQSSEMINKENIKEFNIVKDYSNVSELIDDTSSIRLLFIF
jgi:hypothetical protein